jgi:hypothetical protein
MIDKVTARSPMPWSASAASGYRQPALSDAVGEAEIRHQHGRLRVDLDKRVLEGAPSYSDTDTVGWEDRAWGKRVYDYWRVPTGTCRNRDVAAAFGPRSSVLSQLIACGCIRIDVA